MRRRKYFIKLLCKLLRLPDPWWPELQMQHYPIMLKEGQRLIVHQGDTNLIESLITEPAWFLGIYLATGDISKGELQYNFVKPYTID